MRKVAWILVAVMVTCAVSYAAYISYLANMPTTSKLGWKWESARIAAVDSAAATRNIVVFSAPCVGKLRGVQYVPDAAITGRATNYRKYIVRVSNAAGTAVTIGSHAWSAGVTATAFVPETLYVPDTPTAAYGVVRGGAVILQDSLVGSLGHVISSGQINVLFEGIK